MVTFIIIVLVVAMVVGPIMIMQPSKSDAKRARLRTLAATNGLSVSLQKMGDQFTPVYSMNWPEGMVKKHRKYLSWTLLKGTFEHELHFDGCWDWQGAQRPPNIWFEAIKLFLAELPDTATLITSTEGGLAISWDERLRGRSEDQAIDELSNLITGFQQALVGQLS